MLVTRADGQPIGPLSVWIDGDPEDRPFRGWQTNKRDMEFARLLCRARYYPGTPRGVTRMWFNMYGATPGSVEGRETRPDGLAKNPRTNYQAMFRSGSHQSATRGWLKPTLMTDSLVRKTMFGQAIGKFQSVSNRIVDMMTRVETSQFMIHRYAWLKQQGKDATIAASTRATSR